MGDDFIHLLISIAQFALVLDKIFALKGHVLCDMLVFDLHFVARFLILLDLFLELFHFAFVFLYISYPLGLLLQPLLLFSNDLVSVSLQVPENLLQLF